MYIANEMIRKSVANMFRIYSCNFSTQEIIDRSHLFEIISTKSVILKTFGQLEAKVVLYGVIKTCEVLISLI